MARRKGKKRFSEKKTKNKLPSYQISEDELEKIQNSIKNKGLKTAIKMEGGVRTSTNSIKKNEYYKNRRNLFSVIGNLPFINVNNKINKIGIFLENQEQITIYQPNQKNEKTGKFDKIKFFEKENCLIVDLKTQKIEKNKFTEQPDRITIRQSISKKEEKLKKDLIKKANMTLFQFRPVTILFDLYQEYWNIDQPELYSIGKSFYVIFGNIQYRKKESQLPQNIEENQKELQMNYQLDEIVIPSGNHPYPREDIISVIKEAKVTFEEALEGLEKNKGDVVDTIIYFYTFTLFEKKCEQKPS